MSTDAVRTERAGGVATISLTRAQRRNAIDMSTARSLHRAVLGAGDAEAIVLRADGEHFCVGGDLRAFAAAPDTGVFVGELARAFHEVQKAVAAGPVVVAAVRGWATGAGLSLALGADLLVLGSSARLRPAYPAVGLSPDGGLTWTLTRAVGRARALRVLLGDETLDARQALDWGLATAVVPDDELDAAALDLARRVAGGAGTATKRLVDAAATTFTAHLEAEAASIAACADTAEARGRISAFLRR